MMRRASLGLLAALAAACAGDAAGRRAVLSPAAPAPVGPYSQGIAVGDVLYAAGQVGIDPATGELVPGGIEAEARQALANLRAVLAVEGLELGDVVQAQVFLTDMGQFAAMNRVYAEHFTDVPPARATVAVAALPKGACFEILATAVRR
jgi:2-iminobutanoate/2-iminopropanoate deaminase